MIRRIAYLLLTSVSGLSLFAQTLDYDTLKTFTKEATLPYSIQKIEPMITKEIVGDNIGDLLKTMTPNFIKTIGPGGTSSISLRGGSAWQTQVFWEGIAINSPTLGQSDLSLFPTEFFSDVRIYHTGASNRIGQGGLAGSVSLESSGQYNYGGNVHFEKELGSFGLDHTSGKIRLAKDSRLFSETTIFKKTAQNNFEYEDYSVLGSPTVDRSNSAFSQMGGQQNLKLKVRPNSWLKVVSNFVHTDRSIPVSIGVQEQNQSQVDQNYKALMQYKTRKFVNKEGEERRFHSHQATLGIIHDYQQYENSVAEINSEYLTTAYSAQFHSTLQFKKTFTLKTLVDEYLHRAISDGFSKEVFQNRFSLTAIGSKTWNAGYLSISVQELLIDNELSPIISNIGGYFLFDLFGRTQSLYSNIGTNYRYPSLNDRYWSVGGNPNLVPESSLNYEVGIKNHESQAKFKFDYELVYFQDFVNNWIQWIPDQSGIWKPQNVKSVNKKGVDASLQFTKRFNSPKYVQFSANYRWVNAEVIRSEFTVAQLGKQLIYTPNHIISVYAACQLKKISLRYNQTVTSKFYLDSDNTTYLPYSAPADFSMKYRFLQSQEENTTFCSIDLTIHNLWDETYQVSANHPMPGRWFSVKLTYNLHNRSFGKPTN